jgi:hypothetical protein
MRAARYQRGVNPVQNALGMQGTSRYMNGVRNYAAFTRDKPHVNIGTSGLQCLEVLELIHSRNHRPRRPRKGTPAPVAPPPRTMRLTMPDHPHSRHHQATGREGLRKVSRVWLHRQGARGAQAWYHHCHRPHRILDRQPPLRPRRLPGPRRLHQEHDHRCGQHGRRHHCCRRLRRPDAPDP